MTTDWIVAWLPWLAVGRRGRKRARLGSPADRAAMRPLGMNGWWARLGRGQRERGQQPSRPGTIPSSVGRAVLVAPGAHCRVRITDALGY